MMDTTATMIIRVDRRIGGLEMRSVHAAARPFVDRRIGGLEIAITSLQIMSTVDRRIGGLEIY